MATIILELKENDNRFNHTGVFVTWPQTAGFPVGGLAIVCTSAGVVRKHKLFSTLGTRMETGEKTKKSGKCNDLIIPLHVNIYDPNVDGSWLTKVMTKRPKGNKPLT